MTFRYPSGPALFTRLTTLAERRRALGKQRGEERRRKAYKRRRLRGLAGAGQ
jgi:hypothetical protein